MKPAIWIKRWEKKVEAIGKKLLELGPMHPGSLSQQYHACGNPACRCHHPTQPKKHGPYNKLTYVHRGRSACRFVHPTRVEEVKARLAAYKTFRRLIDQWIALSIERGSIDLFPSGDRPRRKAPPRPE
jgi:hypothetical protein